MARQASDINPDDQFLPLDFGPGTPAARQMVDRIIALEKDALARRQSEEGANRGDAASRAILANQINALPEFDTAYDSKTGIGFSVAGNMYLQGHVTCPPTKNYMTLSLFGNGQFVDMTSGGLAVAYMYLEVQGVHADGSPLIWSTPQFSASKDAGASAVNNVISGATGFATDVLPGASLLVVAEFSATDYAPYTNQPGNFATMLANATFTQA